MNVVIVTMTGLVSAEPIGPLPDEVRIRALTSSSESVGMIETLVVPLPGGAIARFVDGIHTRLQGNAATRMLVRMSPLDRGARFWRAVRRDARVNGFLNGVDLLIAGDRNANFACWQLARRANIAAVSDYKAGTREVMREAAG